VVGKGCRAQRTRVRESKPEFHERLEALSLKREPLLSAKWYNCFDFDARKSRRLRKNPKRGIGFEEAKELFERPDWFDRRSDVPEQFLAIGWVRDRINSVIFEVREDEEGEILHLVTLCRSTSEEIRIYEENS
jgi:uncharacterized DUF497 family protein